MTTGLSAPTPVFSPLQPLSRPLAWKVAAVLVGSLLLTASSYIQVPMVPVPITMQTLAVALVGALYGWRLGAITVIAWLAQGAMGWPVFAGGGAGAHHFVGPTAGYLFAFPVAAAFAGWLAERGWNGHRVVFAFVGQLASNLICLALGAAWLSMLIGTEQAIASGVTPFLVGALVKSVLGAAILGVAMRGGRKQAEQ